MKTDLKYVLEAKTFFEMKKRLEECKAELRNQIELYEKGLSPKHDVCCVLCLEKGEIMKVKEILGK